MSQGLCKVAGHAPKAGHGQSLAGPLPEDSVWLRTLPQGLNSEGTAVTRCCGQSWHCTEEPLLLCGHAALMSLWELCRPSLNRILCIQPGTLRQHMPRGPMIQGTDATAGWEQLWDSCPASGQHQPFGPCPSVPPSARQHCELPQATVSSVCHPEVLSAAQGCEGRTRGTGAPRAEPAEDAGADGTSHFSRFTRHRSTLNPGAPGCSFFNPL